MNKAVVLVALALSTGLAQGVLADEVVYKWKDSEGELHYTQRPPVGIASEAISVKQGYSTRDEAKREPTEEERIAADKAERCRVARLNFDVLSKPGDVKQRDEYGKDHILSPEEKSAELNRAKTGMDANCPPAN